uniref:Uncharacterized protein n=1 Tax=Setaria italica TaxID=4555 RepID=K4AHZ2_SETIT
MSTLKYLIWKENSFTSNEKLTGAMLEYPRMVNMHQVRKIHSNLAQLNHITTG